MIEKAREYVRNLLEDNNNGHDYNHIERVLNLARKISVGEDIDVEVLELACLLHDVDDYKLVGIENAKKLENANKILNDINADKEVKEKVLKIISEIGYNKYITGVRATSLEAKIVSDADMCEALGSNGILRTHEYGLSKGIKFFDKNILPKVREENWDYKNTKNEHSVQHFFDKLLLLPNLMYTDGGKKEAKKRKQIMIDFLFNLFVEEESVDWVNFLEKFK